MARKCASPYLLRFEVGNKPWQRLRAAGHRTQHGAKFGYDLRVLGIVGQVVELLGVVLVVVEFQAALPTVPLGIAPACGANRISLDARAGSKDLRQSGLF